MGIKKKSDIGHAYKCGGIPMYPREHSLYEKHLADVPEDYIKSREKRVEKFLKKFFQDFPEED